MKKHLNPAGAPPARREGGQKPPEPGYPVRQHNQLATETIGKYPPTLPREQGK